MDAKTEEDTVDAVSGLLIEKLSWLRDYSASDNPNANLDIRDIALVLIDSGHLPVQKEGVEPVETIHWFPGDLVERRMLVDGKYGPVMEPVFGLVRHMLGEHGKWTLYVEVPGRVGTPAWPADECRLLRRINWNKEGQ